MVTKKQKSDLEAIGREAQNFKIRARVCNDSLTNVDSRLSTIYNASIEGLETLVEYFPIFEGRVRRDPERVKELALALNRKIRRMQFNG